MMPLGTEVGLDPGHILVVKTFTGCAHWVIARYQL